MGLVMAGLEVLWRLVALACAALFVGPLLAMMWRAGGALTLDWAPLMDALGVSLRSSALSCVFTILLGSPLAWWLAAPLELEPDARRQRVRRWLSACVELPMILPPSVVGLALLDTFGRRGVFGDVGLSFSFGAVVLAQVVVSAPLYVRAAQLALGGVDKAYVVSALTLGATRAQVARMVVLPLAASGLSLGVGMAWARALGELGATLIFAGSFPGRTQTMPLAILQLMEVELSQARAMACVLALLALSVLGLMRMIARRFEPNHD